MKATKARHIARIEAMMMTSVMLNICGKSDNHDMATSPLDIQYERLQDSCRGERSKVNFVAFRLKG
ncbi:MAG: hypothetical protein JRF64_09545 [Deltaproteobacteria bacterium]|nr:hypothetical protein [Deltaproteobacteria bacterium]